MSVVEPPLGPGRPLDHRDATYYEVPRRRRPVLGALAWIVVVLAGLGGAGLLFAERYANYALDNPLNQSPVVKEAVAALAPPPKNLPDRPTNILVIGSDRRSRKGGNGLSDTLILVRLDFKRNFISMMSFPRDLWVDIPGHGPSKLNNAYAFGANKLAIQTITELTGEPINYFFNVDFNAFRRLVNDAGGIFLDVDRHYFNDNSGSGDNFEQLDIKPGYQKLRGSDALDYVRYRHGDSDFGRIARQQAFLSELKRTSRSARGLDNIIEAIHDEVQTNLNSTGRLKDFLEFGLSTEKERIARVQVGLTGDGMRNGQYAAFTSPALVRKAVDEWKNPEFVTDQAAKPSDPSKVRVLVYNASGRLRVGSRAAEALRRRGYEVAFGGDAPEGAYQATSVFYADERRNDAKAIQALFGPQASVAARRAGQSTDADVIVMVGAEFNGLRTPKPPPKTKRKPDTVTTTSLRRLIQNVRRRTGMDLLVPTHLPPGSEVRYVRVYSVERGDRGRPDALTIVFRLPGNSRLGGNRYYTITQTRMKDPPIVATATGQDASGGGYTFYNGKNMQRLLWQRGDMTYWISNTLDESLTATTLRDIRAFMVRPARAKLKAGQRDVAVPIDENGRTP